MTQPPQAGTAANFIGALEALKTSEDLAAHLATNERDVAKYENGSGDEFMGVRMGRIFELAKAYALMPLAEIELLLASPLYEVRVGAVSIMGHQAANRKTSAVDRQALFDLYLRSTRRLNSWQMIDISAHKVIGGYLLDKPREILYTLAASPRWWERRIAVYSTFMFIRHGDLEDAFQLAERLIADEHHFVQTVVGWALREAGKQDHPRLLALLDQHAATMPRVMLRQAIEKLDPDRRKHYLNLKKASDQSKA